MCVCVCVCVCVRERERESFILLAVMMITVIYYDIYLFSQLNKITITYTIMSMDL